ncbi:hypothetical protein Scep_030127 [Stephania cephalantha]|uniref:Uncharacterized protein n=1 Tax=Stephania cephalantha TaxID=152367 RepID=A0AAP0HGL0_9MAGN
MGIVSALKDVYIHIQEADLLKSPADELPCKLQCFVLLPFKYSLSSTHHFKEELKSSRIQKRVYELLSKAASSPDSPPPANAESGKQYAIGTGEFEDLECGCSSKFKGLGTSNASTDPAMIEKGLYLVGWLKRGPTGIIATNLYCAE